MKIAAFIAALVFALAVIAHPTPSRAQASQPFPTGGCGNAGQVQPNAENGGAPVHATIGGIASMMSGSTTSAYSAFAFAVASWLPESRFGDASVSSMTLAPRYAVTRRALSAASRR